MKKIIGLTGNFGCGKSTVAHAFEKLGAFIVDADAISHETLLAGNDVFRLIVQLFGADVVAANGHIDRKKLSQIVFQDAAKRKALESMIHPYVFARMEEEIRGAKENVVLLDVPLLFETGLDQRCDQIIVVRAPEEVILQRLREKGFSETEIRARLSAQKPLEEKVLLADFVIDNQGDLAELDQQVQKVWDLLK